jgi:hypothetical protein
MALHQRNKFLIAAALLLLSTPARPQDAAVQARDVRRLETELTLAKSPAFYLVLDLPGRALELRTRGLVLRRWTLEQVRQSGARAAEGVYTIRKKIASFVPTRSEIVPEKGAEEPTPKAEEAKSKEAGSGPKSGATTSPAAPYELQALEVQDMPDSFDLALDSGLVLRLSVRKKGLSSILARTERALYLPLKTLLLTLKNKHFDLVELIFNEKKESQAIYWTVFEGQKIFILTN